jgi:predicted amidohydrolase YtcJ
MVVLKKNRIADVVPAEAAGQYKNAKFLDYGDQTILSAFDDSHMHLLLGAINDRGGFLRDAENEEAAAKLFYESNKDRKNSKWLLGGAWDHFRWPGCKLPRAETLDRYFPDRCVFLENKEGHGAWVNSTTLRYFGIGKDTPDPEFGKYWRDDEGNPTGYLHESAGSSMLNKILKELDKNEIADYVRWFIKTAHSLGICAVSDLQLGGLNPIEVYEDMDERGELTIRLHYSPPLDMPVEEHLALKAKHCGERLRYSGAKEFLDGTPMGYTGLMIDPYSDMPENRGAPLSDLEKVKAQVIALDQAGIRSRLHACGDMAVRLGLDFFEEARRVNGASGTRHAIEHIEACNPNDIPRFGKLGVIAAVQPDHLPKYDFANHPFHAILGGERMRYSWPFRSLLSTGAHIGFGTDYPVAPLNPWRGVFRAVTRLTDDFQPNGGFSPEEKISLSDALIAYTKGSAYVNEREDEIGTLEAGKYADIAILDRNIFSVEPEDLMNVKNAVTFFDGDKVFEQ